MNSFPKCQVCHEQFTLKGPTPYLLPCLHAVCETCVTSTAGGEISCSACQREVNLTETHLQKDVVRQREIFHLTVQHRPSELLCTHEDDGNQAVCWCQECEEFLCEYCQNVHESFKANRRHTVEDLGEIKPSSLDHDESCSSHTKYFCDFWDNTCSTLICARCRRGDHADHDVQDIDVAVNSMTTEMESQVRKVQKAGKNQNSLLEKTREQLTCTNEIVNTLQEKISFTFNSLKTLLDQREKELLLSLQQYADQTKSHLDSKATGFKSTNLRCKMATEYAQKALLCCSKHDLLKLKKMIRETTQISLISAPPQEWEDMLHPEFCTAGMEKLKSTMSAFGRIATAKDVSAHSKSLRARCLTHLEEVKEQLKKNMDRLKYELMSSQTVLKNVIRNQEESELKGHDSSGQSDESASDREFIQEEISSHKKPHILRTNAATVGGHNASMNLDSRWHFLETVSPDKSFILQYFPESGDITIANLSRVRKDGLSESGNSRKV